MCSLILELLLDLILETNPMNNSIIVTLAIKGRQLNVRRHVVVRRGNDDKGGRR